MTGCCQFWSLRFELLLWYGSDAWVTDGRVWMVGRSACRSRWLVTLSSSLDWSTFFFFCCFYAIVVVISIKHHDSSVQMVDRAQPYRLRFGSPSSSCSYYTELSPHPFTSKNKFDSLCRHRTY